MEKKDKYFLYDFINHEGVEVTEDVYKGFYKCRNRERYVSRKKDKPILISYDECGDDIEYLYTTSLTPLDSLVVIEEQEETKKRIEKMLSCISQLSEEEQWLITQIYFNERSERELSKESAIPKMTIHDRKVRVLKKIRKMMDK